MRSKASCIGRTRAMCSIAARCSICALTWVAPASRRRVTKRRAEPDLRAPFTACATHDARPAGKDEMFETTIAGSLPKPAWLAETSKLWPQWQASGAALAAAKRDATLLWLKAQEDAGLDIVTDGEQSRQHFVHGFLERVAGIDFEHKIEMGIRK